MITTTFGTRIGAAAFVDLLRTEGMLADLAARVSRRLQVARMAADAGLTATPEELQAAADAFRASIGLHSAAATQRWLQENQMSDDDFQVMIESRVLERKLEDGVDDGLVEQRFEQEKARFDRIRLAQVVVDSLGLAEELVFRIREESADFTELARKHSLDDLTRANGGHLGLADRNSFDGEVCEALFAAAQGDIVGPFSADGLHYLFQVLEVLPARFDAGTQRALRRLLLDEEAQNGVTSFGAELEEIGAER